MRTNIKTYTPSAFRARYMQAGQVIEAMLKPGIDRFFIVRVEDMIRQIKLPVPPNRAETHTLIFLTEGNAIMRIGSERYQIFKGECLVVPAGQIFSFDNVDLNHGFLCNFHSDFLIGAFVSPEKLSTFSFLHVWGNPLIRMKAAQVVFAEHILSRLFLEYGEHGLKNTELIQSWLLALICELKFSHQPEFEAPVSRSNAISNQFQEMLLKEIRARQRVADYANALNVSPNHLNKIVKHATGKSPSRWIDETLVLEARVLLYQTNLSIQQVAAEIGIFDASYFSRMFKKYEGVTPKVFRQRIEKS